MKIQVILCAFAAASMNALADDNNQYTIEAFNGSDLRVEVSCDGNVTSYPVAPNSIRRLRLSAGMDLNVECIATDSYGKTMDKRNIRAHPGSRIQWNIRHTHHR